MAFIKLKNQFKLQKEGLKLDPQEKPPASVAIDYWEFLKVYLLENVCLDTTAGAVVPLS